MSNLIQLSNINKSFLSLKRIKDSKRYHFPKECPSCGSKTIKDYNTVTKREDAVRRCSSVKVMSVKKLQ